MFNFIVYASGYTLIFLLLYHSENIYYKILLSCLFILFVIFIFFKKILVKEYKILVEETRISKNKIVVKIICEEGALMKFISCQEIPELDKILNIIRIVKEHKEELAR